MRNEAVELVKAGDKCIFTGTLVVMPDVAQLCVVCCIQVMKILVFLCCTWRRNYSVFFFFFFCSGTRTAKELSRLVLVPEKETAPYRGKEFSVSAL